MNSPLPPSGWVKLNFDGASQGNLGQVGIGCIINNEEGKWIIKRAKHIKPTTNNLAKLEALLEGIQLCLNTGLSKVIIEGDSHIVINTPRKRKTPNWVINSRLEEILHYLDQLQGYQLNHIFREGNSKADKLANKGADGFNLIKINKDININLVTS